MDMTNDELRLQVAQALLLPLDREHFWIDGTTGDGFWGTFCATCHQSSQTDDEGNEQDILCLPNWQTDIAAAWKLFQQMAAVIPFISLSYGTGRCWRVDAALLGIHICADTAERAICLAFLAWKRAQL